MSCMKDYAFTLSENLGFGGHVSVLEGDPTTYPLRVALQRSIEDGVFTRASSYRAGIVPVKSREVKHEDSIPDSERSALTGAAAHAA